jgi:hypothetical protein
VLLFRVDRLLEAAQDFGSCAAFLFSAIVIFLREASKREHLPRAKQHAGLAI